MRIKSAEVRLIEVPYGPYGFNPSWLPGVTQNEYPQTLVRLFSDTGEVGFASTNCFGDDVYEFTRDILPVLLARELNSEADLTHAWDKIKRRNQEDEPTSMLRTVLRGALESSDHRDISWMTVLGNLLGQPTKAPLMTGRNITLDHRHWYLNVALWDLFAKEQGQSIAECLGLERESVLAYASTGEVVHEEMLDFVDSCRDDGYESIKLRIKDPDPGGEELERVREIVDATPDDFQVGIDANEGWSLLPPYWSYGDAADVARYLQELEVDWLEEPLGCNETGKLQRLKESFDIEIVGGELEAGLERQKELLPAYDTLNPDICMSIGFSEGMELAAEAAGAGVDFTPHTWGLGPSVAAGLQIACAMPNCDRLEFPYDPAWPLEYRDAILDEPLSVRDGNFELPDEPGLGVKLDTDVLDDVTQRKEHIGPPTD